MGRRPRTGQTAVFKPLRREPGRVAKGAVRRLRRQQKLAQRATLVRGRQEARGGRGGRLGADAAERVGAAHEQSLRDELAVGQVGGRAQRVARQRVGHVERGGAQPVECRAVGRGDAQRLLRRDREDLAQKGEERRLQLPLVGLGILLLAVPGTRGGGGGDLAAAEEVVVPQVVGW